MQIHSIADVAEFIGRFPAETDNLRRMIIGACQARAISLDFARDPGHADHDSAKRTLHLFDAAEKALAQEIGGEDELACSIAILTEAIGDHHAAAEANALDRMSPYEEAMASRGDDDAKLYGTRAA